MTSRELQEVEEKGKKVLQVLEALAREFQQQSGVPLKIEEDLNLFASAKPCFMVRKRWRWGRKIFYFRNTITNPRQPSPVFVRVFDKRYERQLLDLLKKYQPQIEEALRVRVELHAEEKI